VWWPNLEDAIENAKKTLIAASETPKHFKALDANRRRQLETIRSVLAVEPERSHPSTRYFPWQLRMQVWAWLSHALRQGVLKVCGQARLQDAAWLEQFAMHVSAEPWASCSL
jgi:hypothetical protein